MRQIIKLVTFGLLIAGPVSSHADIIPWTLPSIPMEDGSELSGSFSWDSDTNQVVDWSFVLTDGTNTFFPTATFNPSTSVASTTNAPPRRIYLRFAHNTIENNSGNNLELRLGMDSPDDFDTPVASLPLSSNADPGPNLGSFVCYNCAPVLSPTVRGVLTSIPNNNFSIMLIPDTQHYTEKYPEILEAQIDWIINNRIAENIVYVAHLGDLKDSSTCDNPTVTNGSGGGRTEWQIVDDAFDKLEDEGIPYGVVPGNHDFDSMFVLADGVTPGPERCPFWDSADERPLTLYNGTDNFAPSRFDGKPWYGDPLGANNALGQVEPGNRVPGSNEDNFILFDGACGINFIAINLAYKEGANGTAINAALGGGAEIAWADRLLKLYPDRLGIVTSHNLLRQNPDIDPDIGRSGNGGSFEGDYGADVYRGLTDPVKEDNPNLIMMLSAHKRGEAWRGFPTNAAGDNQGAFRRDGLAPLHAILSDYQSVNYPADPNNADFGRLDGTRTNFGDGGFMRIMRFDTATQMVNVETFAPPVSFRDGNGIPYTYDFRPSAPAERPNVLVSDYFPAVEIANDGGTEAVGTRMDKDTASNFSFSFAGYIAAPVCP